MQLRQCEIAGQIWPLFKNNPFCIINSLIISLKSLNHRQNWKLVARRGKINHWAIVKIPMEQKFLPNEKKNASILVDGSSPFVHLCVDMLSPLLLLLYHGKKITAHVTLPLWDQHKIPRSDMKPLQETTTQVGYWWQTIMPWRESSGKVPWTRVIPSWSRWSDTPASYCRPWRVLTKSGSPTSNNLRDKPKWWSCSSRMRWRS